MEIRTRIIADAEELLELIRQIVASEIRKALAERPEPQSQTDNTAEN